MKMDLKNKKIVACGLAIVAIIILVAVFALGKGDSKKSTKNEAPQSTELTETADQAAPQAQETHKTAELQKNANEKINALVSNYLTACKEGNMEQLQKLVSNGEELTKEQVQKQYEYVEKIQNIDCYTLPGPDEGTYLVYAYYELKFVNVNTVAPGLMQLYVSETSDNTLVILLDELDIHVEEARAEAIQREDVKQLIEMVNKNLTDAANKDASLKELITKMNATDAPAKTAAPAATKAPAETPAATQKPQQ